MANKPQAYNEMWVTKMYNSRPLLLFYKTKSKDESGKLIKVSLISLNSLNSLISLIPKGVSNGAKDVQ